MRSLFRLLALASSLLALSLGVVTVAQPTIPTASTVAITKNNTTGNLTGGFNTGNQTITVNTGGSIAVSGNGTVTATTLTGNISGNTTISGNVTVSGGGASAGALTLSNTTLAGLEWNDASASANQRIWQWQTGSAVGADGQIRLRAINDARSNGSNAIAISRSAETVTGVSLGGNVTAAGNLTVSGTGTSTFAGIIRTTVANGLSLGADTGNYRIDTAGSSGSKFRFLNNSNAVDGIEVVRVANASGVAVQGTNTNDNAATGYVGEYVSSTVSSGSAVALTTLTGANVTSISLTAGDWEVSGSIAFSPSGSPTITFVAGGATTTSATSPLEINRHQEYALDATGVSIRAIPVARFSLSATTTIYLTAFTQFSGGSGLSAYGHVAARRVR